MYAFLLSPKRLNHTTYVRKDSFSNNKKKNKSPNFVIYQ